jgi:hypothetical protein
MRRCFLIIILLLGSSTANAQHWTQVATFPASSPSASSCPYFLNENIGFLYSNGIERAFSSSFSAIIKTTDGGVTWLTTNFPQVSGISVMGMSFVDLRHGYAAVSRDHGPRYEGLWETTDGGMTWLHIATHDIYDILDVYVTTNFILCSNGICSTDGGSTWIKAPDGGDAVVGNGDLSGMSSSKDDAYTSNLGQTWKIKTSGYNRFASSCCAILHTLHYFRALDERASGDDSGIIEHSSDGGASWNVSYDSSHDAWLAGGIAAAGCTVFAQCEDGNVNAPPTLIHGLLRSTDLGLTWIEVGGPNYAHESRGISVVGRGAVVYAHGINGDLWKTTDGGDGTLHSSMIREVIMGHASSISSLDTVVVSLCDTASLKLHYLYQGCDHTFLDTVIVSGFPSSSALIHHRILDTARPDTATVFFYPQTPGSYNVTVRSRFLRDDWLTEDTSFQVTVIVRSNPAILSISSKKVFDFGVQSLCVAKSQSDSITIRNVGCEALAIDSVWLKADQPGNDFSFTSVKKLTLASSDSARTYKFSFKPSQAIKESARIFIKTSLGVDTIYLRGEGVADQKRVALSVDTVRSSVCDSVDAVLRLSNTSCRLMAIDSLVLPPPVYLLPGQLPLGLSSGQSQDINIRFVPSAAGQSTIQFKVVMRFIVGTDTSRYDTLLTLPISAKAGTPAITALDSLVDLGKISTCATTDATIHFASTGCDTLRVSGEQLSGLANGFSILDGHAATLSVHRLDSIKVHFAPPGVGKFASDIIILTAAGNKTVHVKAEGVPDSGRVTLSSTALNLGSVTAVCDSSASSFVFKNTTCNPITVDSLSAASRPFVSDVLLRSKTLSTDSSVRFGVQFFPDQVGAFSSSIKLYYHGVDKIEHDTLIALQGSGRAGVTLGTELQAATLSTQAGQTSVVPVFITGALDQASAKTLGLRWVDLTLAWNTDLLSPTGVTTPIIGASIGNVKMMKGIVAFRVTLLSGFTFSTPTQIATINCKAFVTDTMTTEAEIIASGFNSAGACVSITGSSGKVKFTLAPICSDPTLSKYMAHGLPFAIRSIIPNPTSGKLTIEISGQTHPHYDLFNVLGHAMLTGELTNAQLDLHSLPNGSYYLRLSSDGYAETKRIVKE